MKRKLTNIKVTTLPNGYNLNIGNEGYFYFNEVTLLEGIMYHFGLNKLNQVDPENIQDFIVAAIDSRTSQDLMDRIAKLEAAVASLKPKKDGKAAKD